MMAAACTIVWFRRDLRTHDNPAFLAAAKAGTVIPVFIWCTEEEGQFSPGRVSRWWLKQSLGHLDASMRSLGCPLVMRKASDSLSELLEIARVTGATHVFYNHLFDPMSLVRDHRVKQGLSQHGILTCTFNGDVLHEPWEIFDSEGQPFTAFEPYLQKAMSMPNEPEPPMLAPRHFTPSECSIVGCSAAELDLENESEEDSNAVLARIWRPGWSNAEIALDSFLAGPLARYGTNRKKADSSTTSGLSAHLHFGELSVRKVYHSVRTKQVLWIKEGKTDAAESVDWFLRSLKLRDYSRYLCFNFPFTHERSLLSNLRSFPWRLDEGYFKAWRQGRTGYPLVDAGMRELWATGWLHNRIRVVVASFCVKVLQLPWRWGMKYFWDTLLDADLENDVLGWQFISGSLPDGHELDRLEDPQVQGYEYDTEGEYVRKWLPELCRLPSEWIHHPWDAPPKVLRAAGVELGCNYPRPILDLLAAKDRLGHAIAEMWEREAAITAAVSGESLGNTLKVVNDGALSVQKLDPSKLMFDLLAKSRHDQMVPIIKDNAIKDIEIRNASSDKEEDCRHPSSLSLPPLKLLDLMPCGMVESCKRADVQKSLSPKSNTLHMAQNHSTAESSSAPKGRCEERKSGLVPVWSRSASTQSQWAREEGRVHFVPKLRSDPLPKRVLQPSQMKDQEAISGKVIHSFK
ncbi:hypothetical protein O6H91_14G046000 [Diphasiastrum complanatum]|uniref:Uncharacterized protein n=1 Tax=Diphasiastrum complanatum TaxID=34168 RepID=A0ACC2BNY7_DIPCM|nr:hypothetical protein O6H91_14G046000 [Diphasiastrum complanatum]